jgi:tetratricopeptide (TPR) repeat protein
MRTVNFRLLGLLMLVTAVLGAAAYSVHGYQVKRHADVLLREANLAKEREDWNGAIDYLERYVMLVPENNVGPLAELGLLQADARRVGQAFRTLENVLRQDASRGDVRRRLVQVAIAIGRFPDARHHLDVLLKESHDDSELFGLKAQCQAAMREYPEAAASLAQAIEKSPEHVEYSAQLASLLHGPMKDPMQAFTVLDKMVAENPELPMAYVIRGSYRLEHRNDIPASAAAIPSESDDESAVQAADATSPENGTPLDNEAVVLKAALADARQALVLAPDDEAVLVFALRCLLANDQRDEAGALAQRAMDLHPKNPFVYAALAEIELKKGDRDQAVTWFQRGLEAIPNEHNLLWNLSNVLIEDKQIPEAEKNLDKLRALGYPRPPIACLEARILIQQGKWFDASKRLEGVRASLAEWPELSKDADLRLGICYEQLGRTDLQLTAYRRAANVDSRWVPARLGVAGALLSVGRIDEALEEYQQIAALPSAPASVLAQLSRLMILVNLRRDPSDRDWNTPRRLLDRLEEIDRESTAVPVLRTEILLGLGEDQKAEDLLIAARDSSPKTLEFWLGLMALAERRGDATRAEQFLDEAQAAVGDSAQIRLARARHLVYRQRSEAKDSLRELAKATEGLTKDEQTALYAGLAGWTLAIGDFDETERLCTLVADEQATNLRVRLLLFELAFRAGRTEAMERVLTQVEKIEGQGPLWNYGKAVQFSVLAQRDKQPEKYELAKGHLKDARIARPDWSPLPLLLARINDAQGEEDVAISNYSQAIELGEQDPSVVSRAVALLYQRRRFAEADRLIRTLQERQSPFSSEMTRLATEISLRLNDRERALALVTKAASASKDQNEHIWAGRVLSALGKNEEAETSMRRAIELDDTAAAAWVALIQHLGRTLQIQKAEAALVEAETKIKPEEAPLALAQALESIGRLEEAEAKYKAALEQTPDEIPLVRRLGDFYVRHRKVQDAEPLFQRVVNATEGATDDDRAWSRRNLALVLIAKGNPEALKDALKLVDENLTLAPTSDVDLRAKAMVKALMPEPAAKREAAEIFEKILADERSQAAEGTAESRFVLVQLYMSLRDESKAISHMRKLMAAQGDEPRYIAYYIQFLMTRNEIGEAELWLNRLAKIAPQGFTTLVLGTEIQFLRRRYDDLLNSISSYVSSSTGKEANQEERTRLAATLLETYGNRLKQPMGAQGADAAPEENWSARFMERAGELLRGYTEARPQDTLALAAFYGREGRHDESLDLLEKEVLTARPEKIAAVSATLLESAAATKEQFLRTEQLLQVALEKNSRPLVLILALADLQNWWEKYDEAERSYREVLQAKSDNVAALNNLALLLALRGRDGREALALIEKALKIAGPNPALLDTRATVYCLALGDPRRAADDLSRALKRRPDAATYFRQALIELRLGNVEGARQSFAKGTELGLQITRLHPLERPLFRQLETELR